MTAGTEKVPPVAMVKCPDCRSPIEADARVCAVCGYRFRSRWLSRLHTGRAAVVGGLGLIVLVGGLYVFLHKETVDRALAQAFLTQYYSKVTDDPNKCCYDDLDKLFRENVAHDKPTYVRFFSQFKEIIVSNVRGPHDGFFSAHLVYAPKKGEPSAEETTLFKLTCRGRT
jgi:hypothetical protein